MIELLNVLALWLVDYFLLATLLLTLVSAVVWKVRQPGRRIAVFWAAKTLSRSSTNDCKWINQ